MTRRWSRRRVLATAGAALFAGCSTGSSTTTRKPTSATTAGGTSASTTESATGPPATPEAIPTPVGRQTVEQWTAPTDAPRLTVETNVLVENLEIPWDIAVAPDGDLFVTERVGRVNRFASSDLERVLTPDDAIDAGTATPGYEQQPWWVTGGEGGTLGVAVHPGYPDLPYLFVYYTAATESGKVNRVSRFDVSVTEPNATEEVLLDAIPAGQIHNGGRIEFGPDGALWVTTGEAGRSDRARDPSTLGGKVLRITVNGEPAPGNPAIGPDADPRVFTYGHRNPQGLVWLPDGTPIVDEHGPDGYDEINRLEAGADYGWPDARTRSEYEETGDVHPPLASTGGSSWAPSGSCFYTGDVIQSWRQRMVIGGLISQQVIVATLSAAGRELPPGAGGRQFTAAWYDDAYTVTATPVLQDRLGRVRHLEQGLDGELYAITSNKDGRAKPPFPRPTDDVLVEIAPP